MSCDRLSAELFIVGDDQLIGRIVGWWGWAARLCSVLYASLSTVLSQSKLIITMYTVEAE